MDHSEEHHQHHLKEREEKKRQHRAHETEEGKRPIHRSPIFWVGVAVVLLAILLWTVLS